MFEQTFTNIEDLLYKNAGDDSELDKKDEAELTKTFI